MAAHRRSRAVEIFNFSFLDILACTIALLIFIMVMIFVLQTGENSLQDSPQVVEGMERKLESLQSKAKEDDLVAAELEEQDMHAIGADAGTLKSWNEARKLRDQTAEEVRKVEAEVMRLRVLAQSRKLDQDKLERQVEAAKSRLENDTRENVDAKDALAKAKAVGTPLVIPQAKGVDERGAKNVIHVDCNGDKVVLMRIPLKGKPTVLGTTPIKQIDMPQSDFQRILNAEKRDSNTVVVFWIRPSSMATYRKAEEYLPWEFKEGTTSRYGYEPAGDDWNFTP